MNSIRIHISLLNTSRFSYLAIGVSIFLFSCQKNNTMPSSYNRFLNSSIQVIMRYPNDSSQNISIKINGDGNSFLSGGKNSQKAGIYKTIIPSKSINSIFNKLECSNFFDFHNEYGEKTKMNSQILFHFSHRGFTKNIIVYSDIPDELEEIRKMIEEIRYDNKQNWTEIKE